MAITAAGAGSGLDIEGIISQLVSLERRPLNLSEQRESGFKAQLSDFGRLKGALSTFQDSMKDLSTVDKFKIFETTSSDEDVMTASATGTAAAGTYAIQVDRLAQNHKEGSAEAADTATFGGGVGDSLTLTVGANASTVDLSTAKTLSEVRDTINADANNPGVTATIINTGTGTQRLILTADESGYDDRVQLSYGGAVDATTFNFGTLNKDTLGATMTDLTELDASYSIDGIALTSASNKITSVIDGITLNLAGIGSSDLTLTRDTAKITETAQSFVDAYNGLNKTFSSLSSGRLGGDSTLLGIQRQLRAVINTPPTGLTGSFNALSNVGITSDAKTGELIFKAADFEAALDSDFSSVADLFADDDQGFAFRFDAAATSLLETDGMIDAREDGLNARIKAIQADQLDMEYRLELREKALRSQYAALDSLVGRLNSTSQFLFQQLG